jgi:hypothetical protein
LDVEEGAAVEEVVDRVVEERTSVATEDVPIRRSPQRMLL